MRITWSDRATGLNVCFGDDELLRSRVQVDHVRLRDPEQVQTMQAYWESALERLNRYMYNG
jgi:hypothetical protein